MDLCRHVKHTICVAFDGVRMMTESLCNWMISVSRQIRFDSIWHICEWDAVTIDSDAIITNPNFINDNAVQTCHAEPNKTHYRMERAHAGRQSYEYLTQNSFRRLLFFFAEYFCNVKNVNKMRFNIFRRLPLAACAIIAYIVAKSCSVAGCAFHLRETMKNGKIWTNERARKKWKT